MNLYIRFNDGSGTFLDEPQTGIQDIRDQTFHMHTNNYPNPFNSETTIEFSLSRYLDEVAIHIYDVRGRLVRHLIDHDFGPGHHEIVWDGRDDSGCEVQSGMYCYRLSTDCHSITRKMLVVR